MHACIVCMHACIVCMHSMHACFVICTHSCIISMLTMVQVWPGWFGSVPVLPYGPACCHNGDAAILAQARHRAFCPTLPGPADWRGAGLVRSASGVTPGPHSGVLSGLGSRGVRALSQSCYTLLSQPMQPMYTVRRCIVPHWEHSQLQVLCLSWAAPL